jgi:predicted NUDIX family NTP pyrophosphohydrolase
MSRVSAGLLMYRIHRDSVQVLLAHPGGPFFRNKDEGAWSIPKGEIEPDEDLLAALAFTNIVECCPPRVAATTHTSGLQKKPQANSRLLVR